MRNSIAVLLSISAVLAGCNSAPKDIAQSEPHVSEQSAAVVAPALIDRKVLFGNPSRFQGRISPDGEMMSFRAPLNGVMNVFVGKRGDFDSVKPITNDTGRGIPVHFWSLDGKYVMYTQDKDGDENWHLYAVNLQSGEIKNLTPYPNTRAEIIAQSQARPGVAVVGLNDRDPKWHDAYLVDLASGKRTLLADATGLGAIIVDNNLDVRLGMKSLPDGSYQILQREGAGWHEIFKIPFSDTLTTYILGFDGENKGIYMLDSRDRNTAALVHLDLESKEKTVIVSDDDVDVGSVVFDPKSHQPIAYALNKIRPIYFAIDEQMQDTISKLNQQLSGGSQLLAQTLDNRYWTVYTDESDESPVYKVFDTQSGELTDMFVTNPDLEGLPLVKMHGTVIKSRDNMDLVSYYTLPLEADPDQDGKADKAVPMVMLVHGGPWGRDGYGYRGDIQWLANRGYAVLQVNFRASTGFGKDFVNAGNGEWAGAMHDDLIDAKRWAVEQGITEENTVAIMGGSYGGYATLVGLTYTPDEFTCGVDIVGPSNLQTLLESIPPYWESFKQTFYRAIGDPNTAEGKALLAERSPLNKVDEINKPLLIAQGANDPRVKQAESDQIVAAMKAKNIPVTYVLYPDEGHGFARPENNMSFYAVAESFLASCNGGRAEPQGDAFANSSIQILHGLEYVAGISLDDGSKNLESVSK
ncbi:S9 family peptidase [Thalassotalea mangrovi]|uniref:S9 family peptidase n=1 Tax=Thalassotalea mangrovi TaxID=2572245 RepID=A0A4U1B9B9_9GAMM|nr:S9 family peptidase [Thalassotalea mangrovi]TKB46602.1 S9 family peptidase [Thalassotalea mangrovi]